MIPKVSDTLKKGFTFAAQPSQTIRLNRETKRLGSLTDGRAAVEQAVYIILNVERYDYLIHSWNFGVELKDLFGQQMTYVMPEVKRRIREALLRDDRINEVDSFVLTPNRHKLAVSFTVHSIYGDLEGVTEVNV